MASETRGLQKRSLVTREAVIQAAGVVFSKMSYDQARLKDISEEAGISPGSMYFQFGNKEDIAAAVLEVQNSRMTSFLSSVIEDSANGLEAMLNLNQALSNLISTDPVVQGGIRLSTQPGTGLDTLATTPYFEWVETAKQLIKNGIADGSVRSDIDIDATAELLNNLFVGGQVMSGLEDNWASLPKRSERTGAFMSEYLKSGAKPEAE